ncbi:large ribosomal subunit protein mL50 [Chironomus tepperi]|uniref:large ribosomal subunit protein mL50 n=1 Tax=Chironomus tepperi TaxID=113505 RepID=UPI00391F767A
MFRSLGFFNFSVRYYGKNNKIKPFRKPEVVKKIESAAISLKAKGFLRSQNSYDPPSDVEQKINDVVKELNVTNFQEKKFNLLNECSKVFNGHFVPNSRIYEMKSIKDVTEFYQTPVNCRTPYEELDQSIPNLHIISEAKRYDPETDGVSAFPKSSTLVTSLKHRKKYKGHIAKSSWP